MDWIKSILPTIGGLLVPGSPMIGAAVTAVADAIGLSDKSKDAVEKALSSGNLTADQMSALKKADADLQIKLTELGIEANNIAAMDRDSARRMQIKTGSYVPAILGLTITVGFFGILVALMTGILKLWDNAGLQMLLGSLGTSWGMVVSYYFGASATQPAGDKK